MWWSVCLLVSAERFLVSFHPFGPNNQLLGIRNALILAKLSNRTLVVPRLFSHYLEDSEPYTHAFHELYETKDTVVDLDELCERHAYRTIPAPLLLHKRKYKKVLQQRLLDSLSFGTEIQITEEIWFDNPQVSLKDIPDLIANSVLARNSSVVVVGIFNLIQFPSRTLIDNHQILNMLKLVRIGSQWIHMAQQLLAENSMQHCSVCVHIRPKPDVDSCLFGWSDAQDRIPPTCAKGTPTFGNFKSRIGATLDGLGNCDSPKLFLAMPRKLKSLRIERKFSEVETVYFEDMLTTSVSRSLTGFEESFLEQAICSQTNAFIGSASSTWTWTVEMERYFLGNGDYPIQRMLQHADLSKGTNLA